MEFIYNDGGRSVAGFKGDTGDCVTRAIAITTGKPYQEIYDALAIGNQTQRAGKHEVKTKKGKKTAAHGISAKRKWFADYMVSLGFVWTPTMLIGQGCKVHLKKEELPSGKLIVNVSKHFTTVIDGVIFDTFNPDRDGTRCVYGYYKLSL